MIGLTGGSVLEKRPEFVLFRLAKLLFRECTGLTGAPVEFFFVKTFLAGFDRLSSSFEEKYPRSKSFDVDGSRRLEFRCGKAESELSVCE